MPKRKHPPRTPEEDRAAFLAGASELGCTTSAEEFAETVKGVMSVKPMSNAEVKKKAKAKRGKK